MISRTSALLAGAAGFVFIIATQQAMAASDTMDISAQVVADCQLTANNLDFGAYVAGNGAKAGTGIINYDCAAGLDVDIAIGPSALPNGSIRQMINPSSSGVLRYELYQDSGHTTVWGSDTDALNVGSTAGTPTDITVHGLIEGSQNPPEDTYTDTVTVTLTING